MSARPARVTRRARASARPRLRELAERLGIISEYLDQTGRVTRHTSDATREALLSVMGFDAPTEDAAAGWLAELDHEERTTILEPVRVVERDDRTASRVRVRVPPGVGRASVELTVTEEAGHVWRVDAEITRTGVVEIPARLPYGYHRVDAIVRAGTGEWRADQSLIVVPDACATPASLFGDRKIVGIVANLYSVPRQGDWGVGDLTTLTGLVEWAASRGAAFVGVNPLHALFNRGMDVSPYSPVSRMFRNHIYIDVERVPELARSERAQALVRSMDSDLDAARTSSDVRYDDVIALKERALAELHGVFRATQASAGARADDYRAFCRARDPELTRYATWMAIAESARMPDWRQWPAALHDPDSEAVRAFQETHAERVDFYRWLQFETHRQLGEVAGRARTLAMPVGVYHDLAIGTNPGGSDTWSSRDLFLEGASVGAPPDPYSALGQNWGLPPIDPRALRCERYRYWIQLVRRAFEHAGTLRIDHVMGLFRLFWIPNGLTGKDGAYVRYPSRDLLGILALESVRHDALVVGEDLGTVPRDVPPALRKWGILSSRVLYFERDARGFRPASRYAPLALATANTHDMPTLAGFWAGRDIALREQVGLLAPRQVKGVERMRARERAQLLDRVGLEPPRAFQAPTFARTLTAAVHEFLCGTPSVLVGLSLDDLVGEESPINVPGVGSDKYPSWRRKIRMTLEEIGWSFEVDDAMRCHSRKEMASGNTKPHEPQRTQTTQRRKRSQRTQRTGP